MAVNDQNIRGERTTLAMPAAGAAQLTGGTLILIGTAPNAMAGVLETSYTPPTGVSDGMNAVSFIGIFLLSVVAKSGLSPSVGAAINPGDRVYYDGGTYDSTTGVTYGGTLDKNSASGNYVGNALDPITANSTATIRVRLKVGG